MSAPPLLAVEDLRVAFAGPKSVVDAVRGVSFTMAQEKLGIVGESGSGKSTLARALLRLIPRPGTMTARRMEFGGIDLLALGEDEMRQLRGRRISMVAQDPIFSLNPVMRVGDQIAEACRTRRSLMDRQARSQVLEMLVSVGIGEPERVSKAYPHELSGGMGQRVMIAMMLIAAPDLLIADEPTSALDVSVRLQVLKVLDDLVADRGMGLVFIGHDLNLVASFCDRVLVMYAGRVVEACRASELAYARHPYTQGLLAARPRIDGPGGELPVLKRDPAWAVRSEMGGAP